MTKPTPEEKCSMLTAEEIEKILHENIGASCDDSKDPAFPCESWPTNLGETARAIHAAMVRPSPSPEARVDWDGVIRAKIGGFMDMIPKLILENWKETLQAAYGKGREAR